jgi:hypothetical protein
MKGDRGVLAVLAGVALLAAGLDAWLDRREATQRLADSTFYRLAGGAAADLGAVARVELVVPGQPACVYVREAIGWRLPSHGGAFALGQELEALVQAFTNSRGTRLGSMADRSQRARFGFEGDRALRLRLCAADGTVLLEGLAGAVAPGQRASECMLAAVGHEPILLADANPWSLLGPAPGAGRAPLQDPHVTPRALGRQTPRHLRATGPEAKWRSILRRDVPPERRRPDGRGPRYDWFAATDDGEQPLDYAATMAFVRGLVDVQYAALLGDAADHAQRLQAVALQIALEYDGGDADLLTITAAASDGRRQVLQGTTQQVFVLSREQADALCAGGPAAPSTRR